MPSTPEPLRSVAEEFEAGGFWSCRQLNKWVLVVVTLACGIGLGTDVIYELTADREIPLGLAVAGALSVGCVMLLWVCVTYAVPPGLLVLVMALFVDGMAYSVTLAVLLTGLTSLTSTARFRRGTLVFMIVWTVLVSVGLDDPLTGTLAFFGISIAVLVAYAIGGAFRRATTARLQTRQELEQLEQRHRKAVAAERKSIARDLHDIVAHDITIIAMQARAAQMKDTEEAYREAVQVIGRSSREALNDLRRMLALLKNEDVVDDEVSSSASELDVRRGCESFAESLQSLGITVHRGITGDLGSLSRSASAALYRMLQECTTNVVKFAGAGAQCWIEIDVGSEHVTMCVTNTVAADQSELDGWSRSGAGLIGVQDRAAAFGGAAEFGFDEQGRWRVRVDRMKKA
ncbi:histidine kinase [Nesterenkonia sp.]|uniref:sensor histidine kinase n=1 Tax=Nesterenkonia sp. TaxID=704201 RepID=UPI002626A8C5|nr:histidine kinase [Nesterenkonia sp.]